MLNFSINAPLCQQGLVRMVIIIIIIISRNMLENLTFGGPYVAIYSCNKIEQDALFLNILANNSTCFEQTYCPSSGVLILYSVFTAVGICHTSYVDCLLARSEWNSTLLADSQHN